MQSFFVIFKNDKFMLDCCKSGCDTFSSCSDVLERLSDILQQPHLPPYPVEVPHQHGQQDGERYGESSWQVSEKEENHVPKNP
jgi:hypothetical protein